MTCAKGFTRIAALRDATDALHASDETKRRFQIMAREVFLRVVKAKGFWAYYLPLDVVLALSAMYEIMESWFAKIVSPGLGDAWLGTQGDIWDSQNDMTAALTGAILCMLITAIVARLRRRET